MADTGATFASERLLSPAERAAGYRRTAEQYDAYAADPRRPDMDRAKWTDLAIEMRRQASALEGAH